MSCPIDRTGCRGAALFTALVSTVLAAGLTAAAVSLTGTDRRDVERGEQHLEARALAEAGIHEGLAFVRDTLRFDPFDPLGALDRIAFVGGDLDQPQQVDVAVDRALADGARTFGSYSVAFTARAVGAGRQLTLTATGYVPDRATASERRSLQVVVDVATAPSDVFDYSYFINHWGWFYGDTINARGNVRSNGQFDAAGYEPGAFGVPRFTGVDLADPAHPDLTGYRDDNGDGVTDGSDGGIYAGWDIVDAADVRGIGGLPENQHQFQPATPMPNLSDMASYETRALAAGASLSIGGGVDGAGMPLPPTQVCDAVLGDEPGELQRVVLIGTAAKPILLNGPVVVRGDVIIKGVVSGQGAIYSGRNVYVAHDLTYLNGVTSYGPASSSEADQETWLAANQSKDFLGLFARENVVLGDFTNSTWKNYVSSWLSHPMNASAEDAGADQLPNTAVGRDGVAGTADDDTLEDDGVFTVDHYTAEDAALGRIPAGRAVGDAIPGSGEDIDGDGACDATITLSAFDLAATLASGTWAGNLPPETTKFSSLSTTKVKTVHGVLYTNHAAAMVTLAYGYDFNLFGALVSRNESMIYGTNSLNLWHDRRLAGGGLFGPLLPQVALPLAVRSWRALEGDALVPLGVP